MAACPKCGKPTEPSARICPACGVIMSKVRPKTDETDTGAAAPPRSARPLPPSLLIPPPARTAGRPGAPPPVVTPSTTSDEESEASPLRAVLKVGLAAAAAIVALVALNRMQSTPAVAPAASGDAARTMAAPAASDLQAGDASDPASLSAADVAFLNELTTRLQRSPRSTVSEAEIEKAEKIQAAHRDNVPVKEVVMSLYFRRADLDLQAGSFAQVDSTLEKMKRLDDQQPLVHLFETHARAKQKDWAGAMAAVERYESVAGETTPRVSYTLAVTLENLGRRPDALAVLDRPIFQSCPTVTEPSDISACSAASQMRQALGASAAASAPAAVAEADMAAPVRPRAALNVDASKDQIQSEKFDIRFDGENQTGVARDVLFVLDRAYTRLADIYYDRPTRKIPVVLHSQQDYYTKTGAPRWSGGVYSSHNGAIQIPIRGLPSTLPQEMEDTLVHELSHAFVDEMSGGLAGRELQEGLAQYTSGKRVEQEMTPAELKRLANSSGNTVGAVYMNALVFVQVLVQSRGQGTVNQLLQAIKETGSEDGGFKKTYGQSGAEMKREIFDTFKRRYS